MNRSLWASLGSVVLAAASSACCWLPATTIALGLGAGGAGLLFERYRWGFVAGAAMLLGLGFYLEYGLGERCAPDGSCPPDRPVLRRLNRGLLWLSAGIVAIFALFPVLRAALPFPRAGEPSVVRLSSDGHWREDAAPQPADFMHQLPGRLSADRLLDASGLLQRIRALDDRPAN